MLNQNQDKTLLNAKDKNGETPLSKAASTGYLKLVQLLLEKGADVTPDALFNAVGYNAMLDVVKLLLEKAPNLINARDENGETLLDVAESITGYGRSQEVIDFLRDFEKEHSNKE